MVTVLKRAFANSEFILSLQAQTYFSRFYPIWFLITFDNLLLSNVIRNGITDYNPIKSNC